MDNQVNPYGVFLAAFVMSGVAGVAALLRVGTKLTVMLVAAAVLNSGFLGLGVCLLWYTQYESNVYGLVGLALLVGLGGNTTVELVVKTIQRLVAGKPEVEKKDG